MPVRCAVHFATHSGQAVANDTELCLLWGQLPHRVTAIEGDGLIYVANLSLQEIMSLGMGDDVIEAVLSGQMVTADTISQTDAQMFEGWVDDYESRHPVKVALARTELQCRLQRQSLLGWRLIQNLAATGQPAALPKTARHTSRIQKMVRFMAENYTQPISVEDIASAGGISEGYAMGLFQKTLGMSMTAYLRKLRLYHAKSALVESEEKILTIAMDSGFGSLSRFYEVFGEDTGQTPQSFRQAHNLQ